MKDKEGIMYKVVYIRNGVEESYESTDRFKCELYISYLVHGMKWKLYGLKGELLDEAKG